MPHRDELGTRTGPRVAATLLLLPRPDGSGWPERDARATLVQLLALAVPRTHSSSVSANPDATAIACGSASSESAGPSSTRRRRCCGRSISCCRPAMQHALRGVRRRLSELRYFAPHALPLYFPPVHRWRNRRSAGQGRGRGQLFAATHWRGVRTPLPPPTVADEKESFASSAPDEATGNPAHASDRVGDAPRLSPLLEARRQGGARGNMVRAAVFRMRALPFLLRPVRSTPHAPPPTARSNSSADVCKTPRLRRRGRRRLAAGAVALLEPASRGIWPSESRLLYDLQKVCIDHERPVYAVDFVEWFASWGRRPIKRLLPFHDSVLTGQAPSPAPAPLDAIRIAEPIRRRLIELLIESTHQAEHRLRDVYGRSSAPHWKRLV